MVVSSFGSFAVGIRAQDARSGRGSWLQIVSGGLEPGERGRRLSVPLHDGSAREIFDPAGFGIGRHAPDRLWEMRALCLLLIGSMAACTGCHSAYVQTTVSNRTAEPIALIEVDYPSASFGTQNLAPGADFHYRFKVLGSGATSVLWTDAGHHDHTAGGPALREGDEGRLSVTFTASGPEWAEALNRH